MQGVVSGHPFSLCYRMMHPLFSPHHLHWTLSYAHLKKTHERRSV